MNTTRFKNTRKRGLQRMLAGTVLGNLIISSITPALLLLPQPVRAVTPPFPQPTAVQTQDIQGQKLQYETIIDREAIAARELAERETEREYRRSGRVAFKTALHYVFNTLAYDLATWIASGGEGEQPAFVTEGWGPYLLDLGDAASAEFIGFVSDWIGFDVCEPNFQLKLKIGIALNKAVRPEAPEGCRLSEAVENWQDFLGDENFLNRFKFQFDPEHNGIALSLKVFDQYFEYQDFKQAAGAKTREENRGFKPIAEFISDRILSPGDTVASWIAAKLPGDYAAERVFTDEILADAIDTFVQTLAYKLLQRLLIEGFADDGGSGFNSGSSRAGRSGDPSLYNFDSGTSFPGREAAQSRFADFLDAGIISGGPYELLQKLAACTDINNPAPDECVVGQDFRLAIERELTVREAIDAGLIDGNAPFGFIGRDFQPRYNEGYPYRSLVILRTHRILPVTWEIAAEIINRGFDRAAAGQTGVASPVYTLNQLIADYENSASPFYHLIDDSWVLKAFEAFCDANGYGPVLIDDRVTGDTRSVNRATYCADYQSCLEKDAQGNCIFGYCTEEKRIWNLGGESCPDTFNTCQTFQDRSGATASYLKNTLEYNGCDASNVGCQWYCKEYNIVNGVWTCVNQGEEVLKPCLTPGGCPLTAACNIPLNGTACSDPVNGATMNISSVCNPGSKFWDATSQTCVVNANCTVAQGGVSCIQNGCEGLTNLLPNAGFETGQFAQLAQNWTVVAGSESYFQRVGGQLENVYAGGNSIQYFSTGAPGEYAFVSDPLTLPANSYSFSTFIFNRLNQGDITISIISSNGSHGTNGVLAQRSFEQAYPQDNLYKNKWLELSTGDFSVDGSESVRVQVKVHDPVQTSGIAWFDGFRISQSCILNPVQLALAGTVNADQSKIHFDRDAQTCEASGAGCSQFLVAPELLSYDTSVDVLKFPGPSRTQSDANSYNLVPNAGFEAGLDLWNINLPGTGIDIKAELEKADVLSGANALKLTKGSTPQSAVSLVIDTGAELRGRTFVFSVWAKATGTGDPGPLNDPDNGEHYDENLIASLEGGSDPNLWRTSINMDVSISDGTGLSNGWKLFAVPIHFDQNAPFPANTSLGVNLRPLQDSSKSIIYDDIKISEIDYRRAAPTILRGLDVDECIGTGRAQHPYTVWDNGTCYELDLRALLNRSTAYIRQAPDYLGCRGFSAERPSPYVLGGVNQAQCEAGTNLVWRADLCDGSGNCCHEVDSSECLNYAPYCFEDEVGCQAYTPTVGGQSIPGVVAFDDFCPTQCIGYESYKQSPTAFETQESLEFFIPTTAQQCSASQAGCDEFTNLDEVAQGGEGLGYFSYLRQCALPTDASANCSNFYNWEGSDETGFQLKVYNLSALSNGSPKEAITDPARQPEAWGVCDASTVGSNPFCRELIDSNGAIHYVILQNTVSCSNDCHPFRKSRLNEGDGEAQANCTETNGRWDTATASCIYNAIPGEGLSCSAAAAGCREYRGNAGGNVFTAFFDNFEDGDSRGWGQGAVSSEALNIGGHSIKSNGSYQIVTNNAQLPAGVCSLENYPACDPNDPADTNCYDTTASKCRATSANGEICLVDFGQEYCGPVGNQLRSDRSYLISFWAKGDSQNIIPQVDIELLTNNLSNGNLETTTLTSTAVGPEWQYYVFGPFTSLAVNKSSRLSINLADGSPAAHFYFDNIRIREVRDYVYVIKNSWDTPAACDQNPYVDPVVAAPQFMLGCASYRTDSGTTYNLKSFDHLCREDAIGCQALVDTHNSSSPYQEEFNQGDEIGYVSVPADSAVYMVNRAEFRCNADQKGCERLGAPIIDQNNVVTGYSDTYIYNNPDEYDTALCSSDEVMCEEFKTSSGFSYFKAPDDRLCEYKKNAADNNFGWYIKGSTSATPDCPVTRSPLGIVHPDQAEDWVGLCPDEFSGCTEFIDPLSTISINKIFNADFRQDVDNNGVPDGWNLDGGSADRLEQNLILKPSTAYNLSIVANNRLFNTPSPSNFSMQVVCPDVSSFDGSLRGVCVDANGLVQSGTSCSVDSDCGQLTQRCALQLPPSSYQNDANARQDFGLTPDDATRDYSGRFFVPNTHSQLNECKLVIELAGLSGPLQERAQQVLSQVAVNEVGTYYQLADTVDRRSCNGIIDPRNGCVLFNDRGQINYKFGETDTTYLQFDADVSNADINGGLPITSCAGNCDANQILYVRPDRTCGQWIDCQTKIKTFDQVGKEQDFCVELAACDQFDEAGNCINFVVPDLQRVNTYSDSNQNRSGGLLDKLFNLTVETFNQQRLSNISGYAKAGLSLAGLGNIIGELFESQNTIDGHYPVNLMKQTGEVAQISNGDFEETNDQHYPLGWEPIEPNAPRESFRFKVVPSGAQAFEEEGISVLGNGSLKLNANNILVSETITVFPNTDYALTASINTINLQPDSAFANVDIIDLNGDSLLSSVPVNLGNELERLRRPARSLPEWQTQNVVFNSGENTRIKIKLFNTNPNPLETGQAAYYDDISLLPALKVKDVLQTSTEPGQLASWQEDYISRSCRIFPESTSLSCRYIDSNGVERRGWSGYCLESDPNNPDVCLQWWPVDLIKGDLFGQYPGYQDRVPQYYCAASTLTGENKFLASAGGEYQTANGESIKGQDVSVADAPWRTTTAVVCSFATTAGGGGCGDCEGSVTLSAENNWEGAVDDTGRQIPASQMSTARTAVSGGPGGADACNELAGDEFDGVRLLYCKAIFDQNQQRNLVQIEWGTCNGSGSPTEDSYVVDFTAMLAYQYCTEVVQVVTPTAQNKAWLSRVGEGSQYLVPTLNYSYGQDYQPFGSLVYPDPGYDPSQWDAKNDSDEDENNPDDDLLYIGNQPLFIEAPLTDQFEPPYQVRAGSPYSCIAPDDLEGAQDLCITTDHKQISLSTSADAAARLKRLFAQSYGVWIWNDVSSTSTNPLQTRVCADNTPFAGSACNVDRDCYPGGQTDITAGSCEQLSSRYIKVDPNLLQTTDPYYQVANDLTWDPPAILCLNNQRPADFHDELCNQANPGASCDYCAVAPRVDNISINNKSNGQIQITNPYGSGRVDLSFNATVDSNQLPLSSYRIDWGDGVDSVSGTSLRDRSDVTSPYQFSHSYNYYDLLDQNQTDDDRILCAGDDQEIDICDNFDIYCRTDADCPLDGRCGVALPSNTCAVRPRIQIVDNWGWCNGNFDQVYNTITPNGVWGYHANVADYAQDSCFYLRRNQPTDSLVPNNNAWTYYPGYIIVGVNN